MKKFLLIPLLLLFLTSCQTTQGDGLGEYITFEPDGTLTFACPPVELECQLVLALAVRELADMHSDLFTIDPITGTVKFTCGDKLDAVECLAVQVLARQLAVLALQNAIAAQSAVG
jgi:hypothetical protein